MISKYTIALNSIKVTFFIALFVALFSGCHAGENSLLQQNEAAPKTDVETEEVTIAFPMQDYIISPNYLAAQEWATFLASYDSDHQILTYLPDKEVSFGNAYDSYFCYTQDMASKIDEICLKYGLKKRGKPQYDVSWEDLCRILKVENLIGEDSNIQMTNIRGSIFKSGSFHFEGSILLPQNAKPAIFTINWDAKSDFIDSILCIEDLTEYEQWNFVTAGGQVVLLAIHSGRGVLLADLGDSLCFITLSYENEINREDMEFFSNHFNFECWAGPVSDVDWDTLSGENNESAFVPLGTYVGGTFDDRVRFHLENKPNPEELEYALADIDGDGTTDLLIGRNGIIRHIYMTDGVDTFEKPFNPLIHHIKMTDYGEASRTNEASYITICQGNKAVYVFDEVDGTTSYMIAGVIDGEMEWTDILKEDPSQNAYYSIDTKNYAEFSISREKFLEIMDSCIKVEIKMEPLSQFPLEK